VTTFVAMEYIIEQDNPCDMEAPTGCIPTQFDSLQSIHINECNTTQLDIMVPIFTATIMRLRGGAGDANKDSKFNDIPYLTNINFKWNGLPTFDFDEKILFPLQNGLGSIALHKATLLDTALQKDPGGLLGVPTTGAAPSNTLDEHNQRVRKLFCCLMNYIDAGHNMVDNAATIFAASPSESLTILFALFLPTVSSVW